ncbi:DEAD/DEAH box helicase [Pelomonas sp. APW6]|uniref:DEAD/DEAH box helicase n=1 Tax=Roseateles subflavus TaxID=3053353 RepID=A0ABT7LG53_9BURK|nr:DEAD/DEAH box helicase [Pelomonas sp. APW6]MDL5031838.1 DEAD/DEAH box helicase [Pelomonas sp. APW6]
MSDTSATFASLGLSPALQRAARELGFEAPTPVQAAAIPAALAGHDVLASAETGSGKTAAFAFPLLQQVESRNARAAAGAARAPQVLVLVPTRELAAQAGALLRAAARCLSVSVKVSILYGGVSINPQLMALRGGADIVVATPGRLLDVVEHNGLTLADLRCLVLDEADRLLDAGFAEELQRVLGLLPTQRQHLLFSATFPASVQALSDTLLRDPVRVTLTQALTQDTDLADRRLTERAITVDAARRTPLLRHLIEQEGWTRVLVFVATRYACDHVADKLCRAGLAAAAFHGDASQGARTRVLEDFKSGALRVLVATDLGGRGIDIAGLPVVLNYDLPRAAADYVHRIGRTARAGAEGLAVSFVSAATEGHFRLIEKRQARRVPREQIAGFEPTDAAPEGAATGGVKGRRPSKKDKLRAAAARAGS